jgi:hypothetical protein
MILYELLRLHNINKDRMMIMHGEMGRTSAGSNNEII